MAAKKRDTYKYEFKRGNKILHGGITNDLERREFAASLSPRYTLAGAQE